MVLSKHSLVTNALDATLVPMRCRSAHETLRRRLVATVSQRHVEHGADRLVKTIYAVLLRVDVPLLLAAQSLPLGENEREVVAKFRIAPVGMSPSILCVRLRRLFL
jgi:hypothetical protein